MTCFLLSLRPQILALAHAHAQPVPTKTSSKNLLGPWPVEVERHEEVHQRAPEVAHAGPRLRGQLQRSRRTNTRSTDRFHQLAREADEDEAARRVRLLAFPRRRFRRASSNTTCSLSTTTTTTTSLRSLAVGSCEEGTSCATSRRRRVPARIPRWQSRRRRMPQQGVVAGARTDSRARRSLSTTKRTCSTCPRTMFQCGVRFLPPWSRALRRYLFLHGSCALRHLFFFPSHTLCDVLCAAPCAGRCPRCAQADGVFRVV